MHAGIAILFIDHVTYWNKLNISTFVEQNNIESTVHVYLRKKMKFKRFTQYDTKFM